MDTSGQGTFDDVAPELFAPAVGDDDRGYRVPTVCTIVGVTYRQLDYWARTHLVEPSIRGATGSGTQRLYAFKDILILKIVKRLLDAGISLQNIRVAVDHLRGWGTTDLSQTTLISDGTTIYECTSAEEVVDLLQGGQGVFGIAIGRTLSDLAGTIAKFPSEDATLVSARPEDELSARRARRERSA